GAFGNPLQNLASFSVTLGGTPGRKPDATAATPGGATTCIDPNNSGAGGDYVCVQPGVPIFGSSPTGAPPFDAFAVPTDFQSPRYHYFHATLQRELWTNNSVTVSYVGSRGDELIWIRDINAPPL